MLSEIKADWERLARLNETFLKFWGRLHEPELRSCFSLCRTRGKPPGWHLKVSTEKKKSELTAISRPEPVCFVWSWHPPRLSALHGSLQKKTFFFYAQSGRLGSRSFRCLKWRSQPKGNREGPFGPLVPPLHSFEFRVFLLQTSLMSLGVFFLIQKYAFQETELSCLQAAGLQAQRPLMSASRTTPRKHPNWVLGRFKGKFVAKWKIGSKRNKV